MTTRDKRECSPKETYCWPC